MATSSLAVTGLDFTYPGTGETAVPLLRFFRRRIYQA